MGPLNIDKGTIQVTPLLYAIPILLGIMGYNVYKSYVKMKTSLQGYTITTDNNLITREQPGLPTVSIYLNEISGIYQKKDGIVIVAGRTSSDLMVVLPQVENYQQLDAFLRTIQPFSPLPKETPFQKYPIQLSLIALAIMIIFYSTQQKSISWAAGLPLAAMAIWIINKLWFLKSTDSRFKRSTWALLVIMLCIIASVAMKLFILL